MQSACPTCGSLTGVVGDLPPVYVVGYPGSLGGAGTELWHTLKLWRRFGLDVRLLPTAAVDPAWRERSSVIGCTTLDFAMPERDAPAEDIDERLRAVPGLAGSPVVSFCNYEFLRHAAAFCRLGCRIAWVNCMTWLSPAERRHHRRHGPFDAYVFQSRYQRRLLMPQLARFGVRAEQCVRIPGAFDVDEFPFSPRLHASGDNFVIGRLSRPSPDKFSPATWSIHAAVPYARCRARIMGWSPKVEAKLGPPPPWAEVLPANHESPHTFLASLHCLLHVTGGSRENWPRCGLEAMSTGVPIVAEADFGWPEMIAHGRTGYLGRNDRELAYYAARLAMREDRRLEMAIAARRRLVRALAPGDAIWQRWLHVWRSLRPTKPWPSSGGS